jgi:hypothetical protein
MTVFVANTNLLTLSGLKSQLAGTFINDAAVAVTVKNAATGVAVAGQSWPLAMDYVAASDGDYRAVLVDGLALVAGQAYVAAIAADGGAGRVGFWAFPFVARARAR